MEGKMAKKPQLNKEAKPPKQEYPFLTAVSTGCKKVWNGQIARLRIYDQPGSTGNKVFAYKTPGSNADYVGYSDDSNVIKALFLARDNQNSITGYTNEYCKIEWIDY